METGRLPAMKACLLGHRKDFNCSVSETLGAAEWFGLEECHEVTEEQKGQVWLLMGWWSEVKQGMR